MAVLSPERTWFVCMIGKHDSFSVIPFYMSASLNLSVAEMDIVAFKFFFRQSNEYNCYIFKKLLNIFSIDCNFNSSGLWTSVSNKFSEFFLQIRHSEFTHSSFDTTVDKVNEILYKNCWILEVHQLLGFLSFFKVFEIASKSNNRGYLYMFYDTRSVFIRFVKVFR